MGSQIRKLPAYGQWSNGMIGKKPDGNYVWREQAIKIENRYKGVMAQMATVIAEVAPYSMSNMREKLLKHYELLKAVYEDDLPECPQFSMIESRYLPWDAVKVYSLGDRVEMQGALYELQECITKSGNVAEVFVRVEE